MIPQANLLAEHLAGMVRFPTVSCQNMEEMDFSVFEQFHKYLKDTYPLVQKRNCRPGRSSLPLGSASEK